MIRNKRILSMILIICFIMQMLPYNMQGSLEVFAGTDVVSLNVGDGNIFITETGYIQTTATSTSGLTETAWTGDYDFWGVNTKQYKVEIKSGNPNVTLHDFNSNGYFICETSNGNINLDIKKHVTFKKYGIRLNNLCNLKLTGGGKNSDTDILYLDYESSAAYIGCDNNYNNGGSIYVTDLNLSTNTTTDRVQSFFGTGGYVAANIVGFEFKRVNLNTSIELLAFVTSNSATKSITFHDFDLYTKGTTIGLCRNYCTDATDIYFNKCNIKMDNMGTIVYYGKSVTVNDSYICTDKLSTMSSYYFQFIYGDVKINNSFINLYATSPNSYIGTTLIQDAVAEASAITISNSTLLSNLASSSQEEIIEVKPTTENIVLNNASIYGSATSYISQTNYVNKYGEKLYPYSIQVGDIPFEKCSVLVVPDYEGKTSSLYTDENGILHLYLTTGSKVINITKEDGTTKSVTADVEADYNTNVKAVAVSSNLKTLTLKPYKSKSIKYSFDNNLWLDGITDSNCQLNIPVPNDIDEIYLKLDDKSYLGTISRDGVISLNTPKITNQSSDLTIVKGRTVTLFVNATPSLITNALTYQWYKDGSIIPNENNNILLISNVSDNDFGSYICRVTEANGLYKESNVIAVTEDKSNEANTDLINSAYIMIDELNNQLSNSNTENQTLKKDNLSLQNQVDSLNTKISELEVIIDEYSSNDNLTVSDLQKKIIGLETQVEAATKELNTKNTLIEQLKEKIVQLEDKSLTTDTNPNVSTEKLENHDVILKETQDISTIIGKSSSVNDTMIKALEGWELSSNINNNSWSDSLDFSDSVTTGIFTFFNSSSDDMSSKQNTIIAYSINRGNYKHIFYARRKSDEKVIYVCRYELKSKICNDIKRTLTCNNSKIGITYDDANTYDVSVSGDLVFKVNADFGTNNFGQIYYQVLNQDIDFDPDGDWIKVINNEIILSNLKKPCRLYIKYVDSKENFVVDKTVGFKPKEINLNKTDIANTEEDNQIRKVDIPIFEMDKTIYKGYNFKLNLLNVTKDMDVSYQSSDTKVAKVNKNGVISSVQNGKSRVTGTIIDKGHVYKFIINVTVKDGNGRRTLNQNPIQSVFVANTPILYSYKLLNKGKETTLKISNLVQDAKVTYFNSDKSVISITSKGVVQGIEKGNSLVRIKVEQGNLTYFYVVQVRVTDGTPDLTMWDYLNDNK